MRIIFTRTFNLIGPRLKANLALSNFARQIARLEKERLPPVIEVGDIKMGRDFLDVRDAVRAYGLLMEKGENGEVYNICSGKATTIKEALEILLGLSPLKIKFKIIPERIKPMDIPRQKGDYNKIFKLTGWRPEIPLKQSLEDLLNWWRGSV
jgi:GDP-4-dehydro-6-deoxy-D-mannose reductase